MAKCLASLGYKVTIFGASTLPNSDTNLITDSRKYIFDEYDGYTLVNIKSPSYKGNGLSRKINMLLYPLRLWRYSAEYSKSHFDKPDVIINDLDVMALYFPFWIAGRYKAPIITEVRDLWPESLVAYGYLKANTILAKILYRIERYMYKKSDKVVFSMEGGYDYIVEKKLTEIVPKSKVSIINNGVDLEAFVYNKENFVIDDQDLSDENLYKVVYTGSIRRVNNLGLLLDAAKKIKNPKVIVLIWGDGNELEELKNRVKDERINNVRFKGSVEKKYIPYIVSHADLNIAHNTPSEIFRFGISFNKLFDYLAAGRPVLCDFPCPYNPAIDYCAGIEVQNPTPDNIADAINQIVSVSSQEYEKYCENALRAAHRYDFKELTKKLIQVINSLQ